MITMNAKDIHDTPRGERKFRMDEQRGTGSASEELNICQALCFG